MAKQRRDRKPPGRCVFCGGPGLTKEHVWSNWLKKLLPGMPHHDSWRRRNTEDPASGLARWEGAVERKQGPIHSRRYRVVCGNCNKGWMSRVVQRAKAPSESLITGVPAVLGRAQMTDLATWATLATIMSEFDGWGSRVIPEADLSFVRRRETPPPSWVVFCGKYDGAASSTMLYSRHRADPKWWDGRARVADPDVQRSRFVVMTYNLRHLLFQAFCTEDPALAGQYRDFPRPAGLARLWPADLPESAWPPGPALGDGEMLELANGFYHAHMRAHGHTQLF
jgi:hypothetical protein